MDTSYYVICLIIVLSGYFWGKIANKYAPALQKVNTTALGIFAVFGMFQIFTFIGIANELPADMYRICMWVIIGAGPVLCLLLRVNPLPHLNDLFAGLFAVAVTAGLCYISTQLNTNNLYFDSVYYLSRVIDSSTAETMAHLSNYDGAVLEHVYSLYDYQGYYYFWGMVLRQYRMLYPTFESLTPMYIWCATMIYGMTLGNLIAMSIQIMLPKMKWKNIFFAVLIVAFLSPYYVNYFNTTLAFFGNTIKTVAIGAAMLIAYLYLKERKNFYMVLLAVVYLAALSFSSSCFFQCVFVSAALLFAILIQKHQEPSSYSAFFIANAPLILYFYILETDWSVASHGMLANLMVIAYVVLVLFSFFWNRLPKKVFQIIRMLFLAIFIILPVAMMVVSLPLANSEYGYQFFFESRSENDMTLNYTSWLSNFELVRNIILWLLLLFSVLRFKKNSSFKWMILAAIILFLNPLVCPFVATYVTNEAYCRAFDILVNPFVLVFLAAEFLQETKPQWAAIVFMTASSSFDSYAAYDTIHYDITQTMMIKNETGYDWKNKVTDDQWDMYTYVNENISEKKENRVTILTSDPAMKAYITNIKMAFASVNVRSSSNNPDFNSDELMGRELIYFNPLGVVPEDTFNGYSADYSKLSEVIKDSGADYVIMRTPFAVWDEKGYYIEAYQYTVRDGTCDVVYANNTWILLQVNK